VEPGLLDPISVKHFLQKDTLSIVSITFLPDQKKILKHLKANPDFTFIKWDVTNDMPVLPNVNYVFHLASPASVPDYQKYDEETALVNSVGTRNLLKLAKAYKAKLLFASTSEIYGDPKEHPQKETYWGNVNPNGVRACYDESKRFGEMITKLYVRNRGVDGRIARIFNTYGPNMRKDDGRVISNFINQALKGKPITIYGDGKQTRSFCYVSDQVAGLMALMFSDKTKGEVVNIGLVISGATLVLVVGYLSYATIVLWKKKRVL